MPVSSTLTALFLKAYSGTHPNVVTHGIESIPVSSLTSGANSIRITEQSILNAIQSGVTINTSLLCEKYNGLSVVEVAGAPFTIPSPIVAYYPLDSNGDDASTNNNHLINYNIVTFNTSDRKQGTGAASFNGSNYFEISNDGRFSPDNFSIACWIKPVNRAGNYQSIASCRSGFSPNLSGWMIYIAPNNSLQFWTGNTSGWSGANENLFSEFGNLNTWVHIAFTFTKASGSLVVYINGSSTTNVSRSYANTTNNCLRIGAGATEQNAQFFLGNGTLLDEFRFYNKVLSASEVSSLFAGSL